MPSESSNIRNCVILLLNHLISSSLSASSMPIKSNKPLLILDFVFPLIETDAKFTLCTTAFI